MVIDQRETQQQRLMDAQVFFLVISIYNLVIIFLIYKGFEDKYAFELMKLEGLVSHKVIEQEKAQAANSLIELNVVQVVVGCILIGAVMYGLFSVNSAFQGNFLVKAYTMGNGYLVSLLSDDTSQGCNAETNIPPIVPEIPSLNLGGLGPTVTERITNVELPITERYMNHVFHEGLFGEGVVLEEHLKLDARAFWQNGHDHNAGVFKIHVERSQTGRFV